MGTSNLLEHDDASLAHRRPGGSDRHDDLVRAGDHRALGRADQQRDGGGVGCGPGRFWRQLLEPGDPQRLTPQRVPARLSVTDPEHAHDLEPAGGSDRRRVSPHQSIRRRPQRQRRGLEPRHGRFVPPQRRFADDLRHRGIRAGRRRRQLCRQLHDADPDSTAASEFFRRRTDLREHLIPCNHANGVATGDRPAGHRRWPDGRTGPVGIQPGLLRPGPKDATGPAHVPAGDQRPALLGSRVSDRSVL